MKRANQLKNRLVFILIILSAFIFLQCDSFFTYSPLSGILARDPAYLSRSEKVDYAEAALAARKTEAMQRALTALTNEEGPGNLTASECLLVGQIAMVLAGVEAKLTDIMNCFTTFAGDFTPFNTLIATLIPQKANIDKAVEYYLKCDTRSGTMSGTDYLLGCTLILFKGAMEAPTPPDMVAISNAVCDAAILLAGNGKTNTPSTHMASPFLDMIILLAGNLKISPP